MPNKDESSGKVLTITGRKPRWKVTSGNELYFLGTKQEVGRKIKELLGANFQITNFDQVKEEYKQLRAVRGTKGRAAV